MKKEFGCLVIVDEVQAGMGRAAEVVGVDDKNQDKSGDASDNGDEVQEQAKCGQYELLGRVANRDADGSPDVF